MDNQDLELAPDSSRSVMLEGRALLLVRRGDDYYLYENSCPHTRESLDPLGGSISEEGGDLITCQRHAAQFLARTGECVAGPCLGEDLTAVGFTMAAGSIYLD